MMAEPEPEPERDTEGTDTTTLDPGSEMFLCLFYTIINLLLSTHGPRCSSDNQNKMVPQSGPDRPSTMSHLMTIKKCPGSVYDSVVSSELL